MAKAPTTTATTTNVVVLHTCYIGSLGNIGDTWFWTQIKRRKDVFTTQDGTVKSIYEHYY